MTAYPEGWLARELGLCYAFVSVITDFDVSVEGLEGHEPVTADAVLRVFAEKIERLRQLLVSAIERAGPVPAGDAYRSGLDTAGV